MALITCTHCGKQMSDRVDVCPHCGEMSEEKKRTVQKKRKKRLIISIPLFIFSLIIIFLSADFLYWVIHSASYYGEFDWGYFLLFLLLGLISLGLFIYHLTDRSKTYKIMAIFIYIITFVGGILFENYY